MEWLASTADVALILGGLVGASTFLWTRKRAGRGDLVTAVNDLRTDMNGRMDRLDGRMDKLDGRMDRLDGDLQGLGQRVARIEGMLSGKPDVQVPTS